MQRTRTIGTIRVLAALAIATIVAALALSPPSKAAGGPLDLDSYCQSIGYGYSHVPGIGPQGSNVENGTSQAYHWWCVAANGATGAPLNIQSACNEEYGAQSLAELGDPNDAYTWSCVTGAAAAAGRRHRPADSSRRTRPRPPPRRSSTAAVSNELDSAPP